MDSFLRYFKTIAKRASQRLPLPEADVDAIVAKPTPNIGDFDMLAAEVANDVDVKAARDWVEATFGKPHTMWLYQAAINCKHEIDKDMVVLHFDPKQPGHNALDQLARRLTAHAQARFRKDDAEQLCRAAIACRHAVTDEKVVLHFDISQDVQNALNQLSKRLIGCAKKIFGPETVS